MATGYITLCADVLTTSPENFRKVKQLSVKKTLKCCKTRDHDFEKKENPADSNIEVTRRFCRQRTVYFGYNLSEKAR